MKVLTCPFCDMQFGLSGEDPDASFSDVLRHVQWSHPGEDQTPAVLWPKIKEVRI